MIGDVHKCESRRPRVTLVEMKETNNGKAYAMLVRSLIVFVATVLVICCVLLLYLYLIVRSEEPNTVTENQSGNSSSWISKRHSYYGGSCWSTDCLHAASGKLRALSPLSGPCHFERNAALCFCQIQHWSECFLFFYMLNIIF